VVALPDKEAAEDGHDSGSSRAREAKARAAAMKAE
jgi:hypothetical protein